MNENFVEIVKSRLPLLGEAELHPDVPLANLGLDSLQTVSLLLDLEDAFEVSLPDSTIGNPETFRTPGNLWTVIDAARIDLHP